MRIGRQGICLWAVVVFSFSSLCHAQSKVTPEDEYKKLIRVSEDIQPLGENPFGEQVSLYNGSLSFDQTDISLPGNGPLLEVSHSFRTMETHPDNPVGGLSGQVTSHVKACNASGCSDWSENSYVTLEGDMLMRQPAKSGMAQGGTP